MAAIVAYNADILHSISFSSVEFLENAFLVVEDGKVKDCCTHQQFMNRYPSVQVVQCDNSVIIPGLIDTHVHLPQFPAIGLGKGDLLQWLTSVIFPLEATFTQPEYARTVAKSFFREALKNGTTCMAVYSAPFEEATRIAFQEARDSGIRVFMGQTLMDCNSPSELQSTACELAKQIERIAKEFHQTNNNKLQYAVTPRFAGSCSMELMQSAAAIAKANGFAIQTHLAESKRELEFIAQEFPSSFDYTHVYEQAGLLTSSTILAHSIYLSDRELSSIKSHDCSISHCPNSNKYLTSGIMPAYYYLAGGLKVSLGTDIAGGTSLSVLNAASEARESSKLFTLYGDSTAEVLSSEHVFYLATLGGAECLGIESKVGNFTVGKEADFVVLAKNTEYLSLQKNLTATKELLLAYLLYQTASGDVSQTYIQGECAYNTQRN